MKAIIKKELRENSRLAVLGLVIFGLLLVGVYRTSSGQAELAAAQRSYPGNYENLQPLVAPGFLKDIAFFCVIFGAILGWLQIYHERHRDLWAFLVHRPATRNEIFCGKALAGLALYFLTAGVPLACFVGAVSVPGHIAAPFEWAMVLPAVAFLLSGAVGYFGGMLTGLRQTRWYASRALGLGVSIWVPLAAIAVPQFWQSVIIIVIGSAVLALAAWGSFQTNGIYQDQPRAGKMALTVAMGVGGALAAAAALALLSWVLPSRQSYSWTYYAMTQDGTIYIVRNSGGRDQTIVSLDGIPLKDPKTGRPVDSQDLGTLLAREYSMNTDFDEPGRGSYHEASTYFTLWRATADTIWYYWPAYGRLVGYDVVSRRPSGSFGPKGFAKDLAGGGDKFDVPSALGND